MTELTRRFLRAASLPPRAARLALGQPTAALLALRMAFWVVALTAFVRLLPLPRALGLVVLRVRHTRAVNPSDVQQRLARVLDSLLAADFLVFTPTCWKRAPVLQRFLALEGIETRVVFGVRLAGEDALSGHAWLEAEGRAILEKDEPDYVVTYRFPS
ncbi:MAG TPA: lasso peptide biosynthesis B2 protein [Pyrinomonadaceae bacterium]|jgi:hypothetical protein|nr:lasso peptide biosynthesis B2 protein [Pyrinomonadaceae bacterium]